VAAFPEWRYRAAAQLVTKLQGVSARVATTATAPIKRPKKKGQYHVVDDKDCWNNFGGDPQRTLSRPGIDIGLPLRHFWVTGLRSYIEYPPSYCGGILYVNTCAGRTVALTSHNGHSVWQRVGPRNPTTTPIAAPRRP